MGYRIEQYWLLRFPPRMPLTLARTSVIPAASGLEADIEKWKAAVEPQLGLQARAIIGPYVNCQRSSSAKLRPAPRPQLPASLPSPSPSLDRLHPFLLLRSIQPPAAMPATRTAVT